jgi:hypothetical protein
MKRHLATEKQKEQSFIPKNIGVWRYDKVLKKIQAKYFSRDFEFDDDDNVEMALDIYRGICVFLHHVATPSEFIVATK